MPRRSRSRSSSPPARRNRRRHNDRDQERGRHSDDDRERERKSQRGDTHGEKGKDRESRRERERRNERNRNRDGDRDRAKDRDRSASPETRDLPKGVNPLTESDYFRKSDEFRLWLKEDKHKYFDELLGDKARSYFRKFVKAWNKGRLPQKYYAGLAPGSVLASTNTSYKWSFASKLASQPGENDALRSARVEVGQDTWSRDVDWRKTKEGSDQVVGVGKGNGTGIGRVHGPTLPTPSDITLAHELVDTQKAEERAYKHAKNKKETKEMVEDLVGPKLVGREGMLEKKALKRDGDRAFRERGDEGLEVDEATLMGGGDSFRAMIARRDMAKRKYEQKNEEKIISIRERASAMKEKDKATMDMFQQLAKQRFG